jgi:hypothetical protein
LKDKVPRAYDIRYFTFHAFEFLQSSGAVTADFAARAQLAAFVRSNGNVRRALSREQAWGAPPESDRYFSRQFPGAHSQMQSLSRSCLALLTLALFPAILSAQDATGKLTGVVRDQTDSAVPNAKVTVTNGGTQITKETKTDANGNYQIINLPVGEYEVAAEASGCSRVVASGQNSLEINQTLRIDLQLQIGAVSNTITVESQGGTFETENSTVGGTVTGKAVFELTSAQRAQRTRLTCYATWG